MYSLTRGLRDFVSLPNMDHEASKNDSATMLFSAPTVQTDKTPYQRGCKRRSGLCRKRYPCMHKRLLYHLRHCEHEVRCIETHPAFVNQCACELWCGKGCRDPIRLIANERGLVSERTTGGYHCGREGTCDGSALRAAARRQTIPPVDIQQ